MIEINVIYERKKKKGSFWWMVLDQIVIINSILSRPGKVETINKIYPN